MRMDFELFWEVWALLGILCVVALVGTHHVQRKRKEARESTHKLMNLLHTSPWEKK